ncbi:sarcosine oxidase subunit gamma family protein [uncultured Cohaesibacter sp.]|uniref:sarcosine oxidase subunit gamma n=1 Tax=uncultured Cohaesibacter sp. TaxID=1002546 RepID=UPI002AAAD2D9|nr:sarcosine oxidase subunit gamma family protein [uncultured Cohaesibacter sp.]
MDNLHHLSAQSPLYAKRDQLLNGSGQAVALSQERAPRLISMRGDGSNKSFLAAVKNLIGASLPLKPCSSQEKGAVAVLWMGPDEWLIIANETDALKPLPEMALALAEYHCALVDISNSKVMLSLSGPSSRDVLSKGCSIDFYSNEWRKGLCVNSLYARCDVTIWQRATRDHYTILVKNSFSDYVSDYLLDAMSEYNAA